MMTEAGKLADCPFCGGMPIRRGEFIECSDCSAQGPTDREAVTGWNARSQPGSLAREKVKRVVKDVLSNWTEEINWAIPKFELDRVADAILALTPSHEAPVAFRQCEQCWQPATCKKYGCRFPASHRSPSHEAGEIFAEDDWSDLDKDLAGWFNALRCKPGEADWDAMMKIIGEAGTQEPIAWPEIRRIEMVKLVEYWTEPAEPMWRFEVGGICADFETETGANNFRSAVIRYAAPASHGAVAAALARRLCQMFDGGGESQRSARARHASALFQMLNRDTPEYAAEQQKCDADPVAYLESAERLTLRGERVQAGMVSADDHPKSPTLGSSIDLLIGLSFKHVETLDPDARHKHYRECGCCGGTDELRDHYKSDIGKVVHTPDCPLGRDLPILKAIGRASDCAHMPPDGSKP